MAETVSIKIIADEKLEKLASDIENKLGELVDSAEKKGKELQGKITTVYGDAIASFNSIAGNLTLEGVAQKLGESEEAFSYFSKAINVNMGSISTFNELIGYAKNKVGVLEEGLNGFSLSAVAQQVGNSEEAFSYLAKALNVNTGGISTFNELMEHTKGKLAEVQAFAGGLSFDAIVKQVGDSEEVFGYLAKTLDVNTGGITTFNGMMDFAKGKLEEFKTIAGSMSLETLSEHLKNNEEVFRFFADAVGLNRDGLSTFNDLADQSLGKFDELTGKILGAREEFIATAEAAPSMMENISKVSETIGAATGAMMEQSSALLTEMGDKYFNFGEMFSGTFDGFKTSISEGFSGIFDTVGGAWESLKEGVVATANGLKNIAVGVVTGLKDAVIGQLADMAKQWIMQKAAMLLKEKAFAAIEIKIAAVLAQARAIAASGWALFGAFAIGAAIFAGVMALAGAFANGGIVGGSSYSGDNMIARVNSGEMIINKQQQYNLWAMANGGASSNGGAAEVSINQSITVAQGNNSLADITEAIKAGTFEALDFANVTYKAGQRQNQFAG